jgi:hypothetical protein
MADFVRRTLPLGAYGVAIFLFAAPALGKDKEKENRAACNASYKDYKTAKDDEKAGHLRDARELYVSCSNAPCAGVAQRCAAQLTALNAALPSVVPIVTDDAGEPRVDVQVKVDGQVLVSRLDGWSHPVEPGLHEFSFSTDAGVFATQKVMLIEGERNKPIAVTMHSPGKAPENRPAENKLAEMHRTASAASAPSADTKAKPEEPASESTAAEKSAPETASHEDATKRGRSLFLPVVAGTVGLAGLAAGGLLTYWGRQDNDLLAQCSNTVHPTRSCLPSSVDHIRTLYVAADISFGVAAAGLVAATWLYLRSGSSDQKPPTQTQTAYTFDIHPTPSGAFASVKKAF